MYAFCALAISMSNREPDCMISVLMNLKAFWHQRFSYFVPLFLSGDPSPILIARDKLMLRIAKGNWTARQGSTFLFQSSWNAESRTLASRNTTFFRSVMWLLHPNAETLHWLATIVLVSQNWLLATSKYGWLSHICSTSITIIFHIVQLAIHPHWPCLVWGVKIFAIFFVPLTTN